MSASGSGPSGSTWHPVAVATWDDFDMVLRAVVTELPPCTELLLRAEGDQRVAHVAASPDPGVTITAGSRRLASLPCRSLTDVIDHVRSNVEDHWELDGPAQLSYAFAGPVPSRLSHAFDDDSLLHDLPDVEAPDDTAHSAGDDGADDVAGRLDPGVLEQLRGLGSSALDDRLE